MAAMAGRGSKVKRQDQTAGDETRQVVQGQVEELARLVARQMLLAALPRLRQHDQPADTAVPDDVRGV